MVDFKREVEYLFRCAAVFAPPAGAFGYYRIVLIQDFTVLDARDRADAASKLASIRPSSSCLSAALKAAPLLLSSSNLRCWASVKKASPRLYGQITIGA